MKTLINERYSYKYLILLAAAYFCTFPIIGIAVQKPILLFSIEIPSSTFIYPITFILMDIIAEVYGYRVAKQIIWCHVALSLYYNFLLFGIIQLPSPSTWKLASAYSETFNNGLKLTACFGQVGILVGFFMNAYLISTLKILTKGKYFWLRSIGSSAIGELLQLSIGLLGVVLGKLWSLEHTLQILLIAFIIRLLFIALLSLPASLIASLLKKSENIDAYDIGIQYNPFMFKTVQ